MAKKKNNNEIIIKIEGESWKKAIDKAFASKSKDITIPGFRKGKAPRNVFEKQYGKESLYIPASDYVIEEAYIKALEESKLVPVVQPKVEIVSISDDAIEFKFTIISKPEVNVKKYKELKVKKEKVKVTKEEVEHEIGHLLERYSDLAVKENGAVENGNVAIIDFEGFKEGVAFEGGKGENYELEIGSNTFIPGFEEQLVGMKTGEEKEINVTFPEEYHSEELKGQPVVFKVKVNEIKEKVTRELDKELFEDLAMEGVDSKESLEKVVKENITAKKEYDAVNKYVEDLLEAVSKNVEVDIPEEMVQEEIDNLKHRFEHEMSHQGITLDMYYKFTGTTEKDLENQLEKEAYQSTLYRLMLEEIKNLEEIKATDEEINEELDKTAEEYQITKEQVLQSIGKEEIEYQIEMKKTIDRIKELNK